MSVRLTFAPYLDRLLLLAPILDRQGDSRWKQKKDALDDDKDFQRITQSSKKRKICMSLMDHIKDEEVWLSHDASRTLCELSEFDLPLDKMSIVDANVATLLLVNGVRDPAVAQLKAERLAVPFDVCWIVDSWRDEAIKPMGPYAIQTRSQTLRAIGDNVALVKAQKNSILLTKYSRQDDAEGPNIKNSRASPDATAKIRKRKGVREERDEAFANLMKLFDRNETKYPWTMLNGTYVPGSERQGDTEGDESKSAVKLKVKKTRDTKKPARNRNKPCKKDETYVEVKVERLEEKLDSLEEEEEIRKAAKYWGPASAQKKRKALENLQATRSSKRLRGEPAFATAEGKEEKKRSTTKGG